MDISGKAAIVTGGGSGLGAATAETLAAAGAKVAVLDLRLDGAQQTAEKFGGLAVACDVGDADSAVAAVAQAREAHGPASILVQILRSRRRSLPRNSLAGWPSNARSPPPT
jgi:NAD(P)-dependent dehydrogenase (short-subunit alcohol dehydrogenase family)